MWTSLLRLRIAATALPLVLLAGCSVSTTLRDESDTNVSATEIALDATAPDDPAAFVRSSVDATLAAPSFSIENTLSLTIGDEKLELSSSGRADYTSAIADLDIQVDSQGNLNQIELLADGETMWAKTAATNGAWVEGDAQRLSGDAFQSSGVIGSIIMLRAAQEVEVGDVSELDGVSGREYRTSFTYADALAAASPDQDEFSYSFSLTGTGVDAVLNVTAWIGDDDVVRDLRFDVDHEGIAGGGDMELRDVGKPVSPPEPPPANETISGPAADEILDQVASD